MKVEPTVTDNEDDNEEECSPEEEERLLDSNEENKVPTNPPPPRRKPEIIPNDKSKYLEIINIKGKVGVQSIMIRDVESRLDDVETEISEIQDCAHDNVINLVVKQDQTDNKINELYDKINGWNYNCSETESRWRSKQRE